MSAHPAPLAESSADAAAYGPWAKAVVLRDGRPVLIRQVQSTDAALVADGYAQLSARSRQSRVLTAKNHLSPEGLRFLTDVDHHNHEALGAMSLPDGHGVGIARYIRHANDPQTAEIAITVLDAWQGRGLGTELLDQLTERARHEGIRRFTALISADNVAALALLRTAKTAPNLIRRECDTIAYPILLAPHLCALCGRPADPISDGIPPTAASTVVETSNACQQRWICQACIRVYVPRIQATLDQPWWQ